MTFVEWGQRNGFTMGGKTAPETPLRSAGNPDPAGRCDCAPCGLGYQTDKYVRHRIRIDIVHGRIETTMEATRQPEQRG